MSVFWTRTIEFLLLPPGNLVLLLLLALLLLWRGHRRFAGTLITLGFLQILVLATPIASSWLLTSLQTQYPVNPRLWNVSPRPQAIVVLGAGRNERAPEYGGETSSTNGLERLRYAALLYRQTKLPILITGGSPQEGKVSEAEMMRAILRDEFQVPVQWVETDSHTTLENAELTTPILAKEGIQSAWVVTQNWHMPRAMLAFSNRSVQYFPASCSFGGSIAWHYGLTAWTPQATQLSRSVMAIHEYWGLWWYRQKLRAAK